MFLKENIEKKNVYIDTRCLIGEHVKVLKREQRRQKVLNKSSKKKIKYKQEPFEGVALADCAVEEWKLPTNVANKRCQYLCAHDQATTLPFVLFTFVF